MDNEKAEYWIQTYSKLKFDFNNIDTMNINIIDIAKSLSQQVRFVGHLQRPLSIAQHSLTLSATIDRIVDDKTVVLQALLHDAHEAYVGDISTPLKWFLKEEKGFDWEEEVEKPIKSAIGLKYGVDLVNIPKIVKEYDGMVLRAEAESLFERIVDDWTDKYKKSNQGIAVVIGCAEVEQMFKQSFNRLNKVIENNSKSSKNGQV